MKVSIAEMSQHEKLELMEELWADLTRDQDAFESPAWHAQELADTEKRVAAGAEKFIDWETAKQQTALRPSSLK